MLAAVARDGRSRRRLFGERGSMALFGIFDGWKMSGFRFSDQSGGDRLLTR
jgi:hypothetical protein